MKQNYPNAFKALEQARRALKNGEKRAARRFAEQAVRLAPELEDTWLMMAALASPHASIAYLERALEINPQSLRARKGLAWATERMRRESADGKQSLARSLHPDTVKETTTRLHFPYIFLLVIFACLVTVWAVWQGVTSAAASIDSSAFTGQGDGASSAYVGVAKPTATPASLEYTATPTADLIPLTPTEVIPTATDAFLPTTTHFLLLQIISLRIPPHPRPCPPTQMCQLPNNTFHLYLRKAAPEMCAG